MPDVRAAVVAVATTFVTALGLVSVGAATNAASAARRTPPTPAQTQAARDSAAPNPAGTYRWVPPTRLLDTRHVGGAMAPHGTRTVQVGGRATVPGSNVSAVAVTITALTPSTNGGLVAYPSGGSRPATTDVVFSAGRTTSGLTVSRVSSHGALTIYNQSATAHVNVAVDVSGYYVGGTPSGLDPGVLHPLATPTRVVDTRTTGAVRAGNTIRAQLGGAHGLPSTGIGAVAVVLSPLAPTRSGGLVAFARGNDRPFPYSAQFTGGTNSAAFAVVPTDKLGGISINNSSGGTVQVVVDLVGWFPAGVATTAGATQPRYPYRAVNGDTYAAGRTATVALGGKGGVPLSGVKTVLASISVGGPTGDGGISTDSGVTNVQFQRGRAASDLVALHVVDGEVQLTNRSTGTVRVFVDIVGFVPQDSLAVPTISTSRYLGDLTLDQPRNTQVMKDHGCADARAGSTFVLIDVGAQSVTGKLANNPGVSLANVPNSGTIRLTYATLVARIGDYLGAFHRCAVNRVATIAVGTNTSGVWTSTDPDYYAPSDRGTDWANDVVDAITPPDHLTVAGANDIEPGFDATQTQALTWESSYFAATQADLVFNGSADGCPDGYGTTTGSCLNGWTMSGLNNLAALNSHVLALPQIYGPSFAARWANIDAVGHGNITFVGSLTEHAVDPATYSAVSGYAALHYAIGSVTANPSIPVATDITNG